MCFYRRFCPVRLLLCLSLVNSSLYYCWQIDQPIYFVPVPTWSHLPQYHWIFRKLALIRFACYSNYVKVENTRCFIKRSKEVIVCLMCPLECSFYQACILLMKATGSGWTFRGHFELVFFWHYSLGEILIYCLCHCSGLNFTWCFKFGEGNVAVRFKQRSHSRIYSLQTRDIYLHLTYWFYEKN